MPQPGHTTKDVERLWTKAGLTKSQIAKTLDIKIQSVNYHLKKLGLYEPQPRQAERKSA